MHMYETLYLLAATGIRKNSTVACGLSPIKIHYFDYLKRLINRINNKAYVSFTKISRYLLKTH